jgi:hypothetical protein
MRKFDPARSLVSLLLAAVGLTFSAGALAEESGQDRELTEPERSSESPAARGGGTLLLSQPATLGTQHAFGSALGGYDSARRSSTFEANAEARVWGPLSVRGGAVYTGRTGTLRPAVGGRVQLLRQQDHGLDGAVGVFYRPEGLTEPEGELETVASLGARLGRSYLLGNLVYGQDPEGAERDGELRLALLRPVGERLLLGFDSRVRIDLGSQPAHRASHDEAKLDALAGPTAALVIGPLSFMLQGGASVVRLTGAAAAGAFVLAGAGTSF